MKTFDVSEAATIRRGNIPERSLKDRLKRDAKGFRVGLSSRESHEASLDEEANGNNGRSLNILKGAIFTDVFDTILIRLPISERRRQYEVASRIVADGHFGLARTENKDNCIDAVYWSRRKAQNLAFRGLSALGEKNEVSLSAVLNAQAKLLNLGDGTAEALKTAELEVEKQSLRLNETLIAELTAEAAAGTPIYAISDTMLSEADLKTLISHFTDIGLFKRIYSSAEEKMTKREGSLFKHVIAQNDLDPSNILHIGDCPKADGKQARAAGLSTRIVPRSKLHKFRTKLNGARFELAKTRRNTAQVKPVEDEFTFGRHVIGPIYASFCAQLWLYFTMMKDHHKPSALFCARGGLVMRELYEIALKSLSLPANSENQDFMISRFVLAKSGLLAGDEAVLREIGREHVGRKITDVVQSFSGNTLTLPDVWDKPYSVEGMQALLASEDSASFRAYLSDHDTLLRQHFKDKLGKSDCAVLVDTGLYGSIQLFLQNLMPKNDVTSVLLARSNYKGFSTEHFSSVIGILSERNLYTPVNLQSAILRYWQLIEEIFEPELQSVTSFKNEDQTIISNLEVPGWRSIISNHDHPVYLGAKDYIESLSPCDLPKLIADERAAWKAFKRIVIFPSREEAHFLSVGQRARDFGLDGYASDVNNMTENRSVRFKHAHWKNGAAHTLFPTFVRPIHYGMETGYMARNVRAAWRGIFRKSHKKNRVSEWENR